MGILRVYLALCVVAAHSSTVFPWGMHGGGEAVEIFYIISGFYMAMVLSSRYTDPKVFYVSRLLRIFPPYWIVLVATLIISAVFGLLRHNWLVLTAWTDHPLGHNGLAGLWLAILFNLTLIGQDWLTFLGHNAGQSLHFTGNFRHDADPLVRYLLVPQAWSIGVELTFYACAPFLNRSRSRWLVGIALAALAARLACYAYLGLAHDPWNYRFFPFEITLFIFGMLAYRLYARTASRHPSQQYRCVSLPSYLAGAVVLLLLLYVHRLASAWMYGKIGDNLGVLITYPFWALGLPVLFFIFGNSKLDRSIGELSYPIYLVHILVLSLARGVLGHYEIGKQWEGIISAVVSVAVAAFFYRVYIAPLDRKRHLLSRTGTDPAPLPADPVAG